MSANGRAAQQGSHTAFRHQRSERQDTTASRRRNQDVDPKAFQAWLEKQRTKILPYLPPGATPDKYLAATARVALDAPDLYACTTRSILSGIIKTAQTGLVLGSTCFLVPYKGVATWIAHYKGLMLLAYNSGQVASITADVVREGEIIRVVGGSNPQIAHQRKWKESDLPIVGAYAVAEMRHGTMKPFALLNDTELENIRQEFSQKWRKGGMPPWWAKKTAIRQLVNQQLPQEGRLALAVAYESDAVLPRTWEQVTQAIPSVSGAGVSTPTHGPAVARVAVPVPVTNAEAIDPADAARMARRIAARSRRADQDAVRRGLEYDLPEYGQPATATTAVAGPGLDDSWEPAGEGDDHPPF